MKPNSSSRYDFPTTFPKNPREDTDDFIHNFLDLATESVNATRAFLDGGVSCFGARVYTYLSRACLFSYLGALVGRAGHVCKEYARRIFERCAANSREIDAAIDVAIRDKNQSSAFRKCLC